MYEQIKKELYAFHSLSSLKDEELYRLINSVFIRQELEGNINVEKRQEAIEQIFSSIRGLGILDELLNDDSISEIMINSFDEIYIERNGETKQIEKRFDNEKHLLDVIQRIVGKSGREVNTANPIVDTRLFSGERVNVVLPPISLSGPVVTIRRFPKERIVLEDLIRFGSITAEAAEFLKRLVKRKYNIFISGGTSSGKTTFLNALSDYIPKNERIITIEDSAELQIFGIKNLIRLEARNANTSGAGEITIKELIRTSLRMRPDRIIVGEVRGEEALDMLNAMNTGHDGSLSTGHANSSFDMICRLETMVLQSGVSFPLLAIRQHIASSIDIIVHLQRDSLGKRRVVEISEIVGMENGEIKLNPLYKNESGKLIKTKNKLINIEKLNMYGEKDENQEKAK
ncbi:MAG: CpaF family protein [Ruminococcaceae bacterium]|nr:CpaF family protein [Oscillospiraceae bacterium]